MSVTLNHNAYGKSAVRLTKVVRTGDVHELFEIDAKVQLEGDFESAYTDGDNRKVIATDSIKNTVYVLAKEQTFDSIEQFALILTRHFIETYRQVSRASVELVQTLWQRIEVDGRPHDHSFTGGGDARRVARASLAREQLTPELSGGFRGMKVLKTTASEWKEFWTDRYRTLKDATDRILATAIDAEWTFATLEVDANAVYSAVESAMLNVFATEHSLGAQQTLLAMGKAALAVAPEIDRIHLELPNLHRIPFNLQPFGLKFENDIFVATDEPHGLITGTISRSE